LIGFIIIARFTCEFFEVAARSNPFGLALGILFKSKTAAHSQ
jgi:hypothetical protein